MPECVFCCFGSTQIFVRHSGLNDETLTDGVWMGGHFRVSPWQGQQKLLGSHRPKKKWNPMCFFQPWMWGTWANWMVTQAWKVKGLPIDFTRPNFATFFDRFSDGFERDELDLDESVMKAPCRCKAPRLQMLPFFTRFL